MLASWSAAIKAVYISLCAVVTEWPFLEALGFS